MVVFKLMTYDTLNSIDLAETTQTFSRLDLCYLIKELMFIGFAEFERDRIRARTIEGQANSQVLDKTIRKPTTIQSVAKLRSVGFSVAKTASKLNVS